ncbi:MAG: hypothetical protein KGR26_09155 [Cyanobacteria bacterium REEB65]|nr:hypothetical protein [Cyanobacteria bacterium REEB65]
MRQLAHGILNSARSMSLRRWVGLALALAVPAALLGDPSDRRQVHRLLSNVAAGRPALRDVTFVFPLLPHPTPSPSPVPEYPDTFVYGNDVSLQYEDLGGGYWQTAAFSMLAGELPAAETSLGQFLFKDDPLSDPLHPGHEIVAVNGSPFRTTFANLGPIDSASALDLQDFHWPVVPAGQEPAAWNLRPGDMVVIRLIRTARLPQVAGSQSATASRSPLAPVTYAKVFIRKLSHDDVRFDFAYQPAGSASFPRPHGR